MDECIRKGVTSNEEYLPGRLKVKRRAKNLYKRFGFSFPPAASSALARSSSHAFLFPPGATFDLSLTKGFYAPGEPNLTVAHDSQIGSPGALAMAPLGPQAQPQRIGGGGGGGQDSGGVSSPLMTSFDVGSSSTSTALRGLWEHPIPPIAPVWQHHRCLLGGNQRVTDTPSPFGFL
jgi:hypothetical protein